MAHDIVFTPAPDDDVDEADLRHDVAQNVLYGAIHHDHKDKQDVYCLGPVSGRINFVSQQYRAFNLVWALKDRHRLDNKSHVAIIGGGLSGLTAAAALLAFGLRVTVYEQMTLELIRQRVTRHRVVYPKINWWPGSKTADTLNPTSNLPFMNWQTHFCNEITNEVLTSWDALKGAYPDELFFEGDCVYKDIHRVAYYDRKPQIIYTDKRKRRGPDEVSRPYDLIILAVGFGKERQAKVEYWQHDGLEERLIASDAPLHWIVSGSGDGGMIDALRIAYEFDYGRLAYKLALALHETHAEQEIRAFKDSENLHELHTKYSALGLRILRAKEYHQVELDKLTVLTQKLAAGTDEAQRVRLEDEVRHHESLRNYFQSLFPAQELVLHNLRDNHSFISIVDKEYADPAHGKAAPIYKLMVSMAISKGVVTPYRGEVTLKAVGGKQKYIIESSPGVLTRKPLEKKSTEWIIRTGAPQQFRKYAKARAARLMDAAAELAVRYHFRPAWPKHYIYPRPKFSPVKEAEYRDVMRERGISALQVINSQGDLKFYGNRFEVIDHKVAYRPTHLYGIPVTYDDTFGARPSRRPNGVE